ncbi:hypothetical protein FNV43_RR21563 [Rhamnella rubrinervis]|uniref:Uncharacterized protein n=1 Tax=Rhamnella rubrinervis TaxID=2594499 RepID=A0A8K0E2H8_9ROSA|nr:hypothetical protein FNV43_RR21563 [Rhamnella rubrinervis]
MSKLVPEDINSQAKKLLPLYKAEFVLLLYADSMVESRADYFIVTVHLTLILLDESDKHPLSSYTLTLFSHFIKIHNHISSVKITQLCPMKGLMQLPEDEEFVAKAYHSEEHLYFSGRPCCELYRGVGTPNADKLDDEGKIVIPSMGSQSPRAAWPSSSEPDPTMTEQHKRRHHPNALNCSAIRYANWRGVTANVNTPKWVLSEQMQDWRRESRPCATASLGQTHNIPAAEDSRNAVWGCIALHSTPGILSQ